MWVLETVAVAFGLYSALPVPQVEWNEKNMRYALCAFPLVGAAVGLGWWGWDALSGSLGLSQLLRGAGFCALPVLVTGGIHLDGYADTQDALASHGSPQRKQEILRDPHCGAFAVIWLCLYFAGYFALCCTSVPWEPVALSFLLSRTLSGLSLTLFPQAQGSSLAKAFADRADRGRVRWILGVQALVWGGGLVYFGGVLMLAALALVFAHYSFTVKRQFGGLSGDLAGWFLVRAEFWMLAALVLKQYMEGTL